MDTQQNTKIMEKNQLTLYVKTNWNQVWIYELPFNQQNLQELKNLQKRFSCESLIRRNDGTQITLHIQYPYDNFVFHRPAERIRELFALASSHTTCMCYWIKQSNRTLFYSTNSEKKFTEYNPPILEKGVRHARVR